MIHPTEPILAAFFNFQSPDHHTPKALKPSRQTFTEASTPIPQPLNRKASEILADIERSDINELESTRPLGLKKASALWTLKRFEVFSGLERGSNAKRRMVFGVNRGWNMKRERSYSSKGQCAFRFWGRVAKQIYSGDKDFCCT